MGGKAITFMTLLAIQVGVQPILNKSLVANEVNPVEFVIAVEIAKLIVSILVLSTKKEWEWAYSWTFKESIMQTATPSVLFAFQNMMLNVAIRHTDEVSFTVINQSKIIFNAVCLYFILGKPQSRMQMIALVIVTVAATLISLPSGGSTLSSSTSTTSSSTSLLLGPGLLAVASILSGFNSVMCEWALQRMGRNPLLFTIELAVYGCTVSCMFLAHSQFGVDDPRALLYGWTWWTVIPIITNALGGILVGEVVRHAGGVEKGISLVGGICLTALLRVQMMGQSVSLFQLLAIVFICIGSIMHIKCPPAMKLKTV
jgi:UDP-sugar transporter A1/2/3